MTIKTVFSTPWFDIVAKTARDGKEPHYILTPPDYVTVFAVTHRGTILLVKQYRPAIDEYTLEFPSGHVDEGETPENAARREFEEETGYRAEHLEFLGCLAPDVGRMANRMWLYYAPAAVPALNPPVAEEGVEVIECLPAELTAHIKEGRFIHALNMAILPLVMLRGGFSF